MSSPVFSTVDHSDTKSTLIIETSKAIDDVILAVVAYCEVRGHHLFSPPLTTLTPSLR